MARLKIFLLFSFLILSQVFYYGYQLIDYQKIRHFFKSLEILNTTSDQLLKETLTKENQILSKPNLFESEIQMTYNSIIDHNSNQSNLFYRCVNIYLPSSSSGLRLDATIYNNVLHSKIQEGWKNIENDSYSSFQSSKADLYIEQTPTDNSQFYKKHPVKQFIWWMPNAEFSSMNQFVFPNVSLVFAKTKHTLNQLLNIRKTHANKFLIYYSKHTSEDFYLSSIKKDYSKVIHVAGSSLNKNTKLLIDIWIKHPEWPKIVILARQGLLIDHYNAKVKEKFNITSSNDNQGKEFPNIHFIKKKLPIEELKELMNEYGLHLCPSGLEGFGHYINEARSTKAVILTGNISPTNELVTNKTGILVGKPSKLVYAALKAQVLDVTFEDLEKGINDLLLLNETDKIRMGELARAAFLDDQKHFKSAMNALNSTVCGDDLRSTNFLKYIYPRQENSKQENKEVL